MTPSDPGGPVTGSGDPGAATAVLLREAQHRVRNDLQTVFSILRLAERRSAREPLRTEDVLLWLNCFACVYDALPIWDQNRRIGVRALLSVLRERVQSPRIDSLEDDGASVPGTSGVAVALALSTLLDYARLFATAPASMAIRECDRAVRVSIAFEDGGAAPLEWTTLSGRMAADALCATYVRRREGSRAVMDLEMPCR